MNQQAFDFDEPAYPRFDKLLGTANAELIYILQQEHDQFLYIWGEQGSGKSHILQAWVGQAVQAGYQAVYIDVGSTPLTDNVANADFIAIDQIEKLSAEEQATLFYIFNSFRNSHKGHLLLSAEVPPAKLQLREDLRTRMGFCLAYEVKSLSKEEKIDALTNMAKTRQLNIDPIIYQYLLEHWRQDLNSLIKMFNDLANYSITQGKPITLPLLRRLLKQQETK
ncbi:DnaA regulatory inactivator Hda [Kingella negevensis]|uniref:DnaA regulatory inactivator Hda n=1 Tax=Kingella negevensis TaxID=1522312 RepID=A0A238HGM2_9NEIS|nr:DnaA regulatory inactivator Hda [Kingella negevensis]MDK4681116.1 DnaA regulatory inactivator Hda [Kingella negevensis]MDK4683318.1 DnaA regulatory inactivator Hda [Kingella negevensis]MDK4684324.1 DnaA regulatory inactivator Hda [Kingella negevensis]MDK4691550.1 DnaA regulatory inactivator Hda [Kingella negevensis]MDK4693299.1 DnaA regulatory inactivator Hda [Kingella negevensis]